jgi:hypothetical protein
MRKQGKSTGEVLAEELVPVFPVFIIAVGIMIFLEKRPILAGTHSLPAIFGMLSIPWRKCVSEYIL